jgi:hypothetical protein
LIDGVFFKSIPIGSEDFIVVHETGVVRLNRECRVLWSVSTDIVADGALSDNEVLILRLMDSTVLAVSINSGEISPNPTR